MNRVLEEEKVKCCSILLDCNNCTEREGHARMVIVVVVVCGWGALLLAIELCTYTIDCTLTEWFDLLGLETTLLTITHDCHTLLLSYYGVGFAFDELGNKSTSDIYSNQEQCEE